MENITVRRKTFNLIKTIDENTLIVERKNKQYLYKQHSFESFYFFAKHAKRLKNTAIETPKVYLLDKKNYISVSEYFDAKNMLEVIAEKELDDDTYKLLFFTVFYARIEKLRINLMPEAFKLVNGKLIYYTFEIEDNAKPQDFVNEDMKYWFYTKECQQHLKDNGFEINQSRVKSEYETNKLMALKAVLYYR